MWVVSFEVIYNVTRLQGCRNPGCQVSWVTKFYMAKPNVRGSSVWNLLRVTLLVSRIWLPRYKLVYMKIVFLVFVEKGCSNFMLIRKLYWPYVTIALYFSFTISLWRSRKIRRFWNCIECPPVCGLFWLFIDQNICL